MYISFPWKAVELHFTAVLFVFQDFPLCNFAKFVNFGSVFFFSQNEYKPHGLPSLSMSHTTVHVMCSLIGWLRLRCSTIGHEPYASF